jgi:hypothetical protein
VAHACPVRGQVSGKLHQEEERPGPSTGSKGNNSNNARPAKLDKYLVKLEAEYLAEELKARIRAAKMMSQGVTDSQVVEGPADPSPPHRVPTHVVPFVVRTAFSPDGAIPAHVLPRVVRTALTPDGAIAILKDTIERLRIPQ